MGFSLSKLGDKLKEALIKVRMKIAFAPLPFWGGAQLRQRQKQITCVRGLSARAFFLGNYIVD